MQQEFFLACICQLIDNLHAVVCGFGEYAMNLDRSIKHNSFKNRGQNFNNDKW